jgi:hypothetical protein
MHPTLAAAFEAEVEHARRALANDRLSEAFAHLERAHVLGQWYVRSHLTAHLGMLRIGWRRRDVREIIGQLLRTSRQYRRISRERIPTDADSARPQ